MCEAFMSCFGHSAPFEHVITYPTKDLKLLFTCESISILTLFHNLEHVCFRCDHL